MIDYRNATEGELAEVLNWAAEEGWNPGLDDASAFFSADPDGFFLAVDGSMPVAAISVVNHNANFAFLGLYIVRPPYRGKGIGYGLWNRAIRHAGTRIIGLDGVPEQQANYAASGFVNAGGTTRFSGPIEARPSATIRLAAPDDVANLIEAEAKASGTRKDAYLSAWFSNTETRKTLVDTYGFCTVRKCRVGAKIGPLLARSQDAAERLIHHAATVFGAEIIVDVPKGSEELTRLCNSLYLAPGFETARMYRGAAPQGERSIFAVTSLELG